MISDHRQNPVVLLVDDELDIVRGYEMTLKSRGIRNVLTCTDSLAVMDLLEKNSVDVILLDLMMPGISGLDLLKKIVEMYPEIPVIIVTAVNDVQMAVQCLQLGAKDYMLKPVERNHFISGVKRMLEFQNLQRENKLLKKVLITREILNPLAFAEIITRDEKMYSLFRYIEAVAASDEPVLLTGETGVGKELFARALHQVSEKKGNFVSINVAGLDDNMFSDTLFGHTRGAFTNAVQHRDGLIEEAKSGNLFLDEIGDLGMASQIKLLRLLQEKEYYPLGSDKIKRSDCRIICSTNKDLEELLSRDLFRRDLYFRLKTHHMHIPPLRERMGDLPLLVNHFIQQASKSYNRPALRMSESTLKLLESYSFPGNIRELRALIYDSASKSHGDIISQQIFEELVKKKENPIPAAEKISMNEANGLNFSTLDKLPKLEELERMALIESLRRSKGNMSQAAKILGINRQTMSKKIQKLKSTGYGKRAGDGFFDKTTF